MTPEYNHSVPDAMKNAFGLLFPERKDKTIAFVGYGTASGVRAVEHWCSIAATASMFATRSQVAINIFTDFPRGEFTPTEQLVKRLSTALAELVTLASRIGSPALTI